MMSEGQVLSARLRPATVIDRTSKDSPDYFLDWAFEEVKSTRRRMAVAALVARTTIDLDMQRAAEESLEFHLRQHGAEYKVTEGAIVLIESDGAVRAMVGGRDYGAASSTARRARCARPAHPSRPMSTRPRWRAGFTPSSVISDGPDQLGRLVAPELCAAGSPAA